MPAKSLAALLFLLPVFLTAQNKGDTAVTINGKVIVLSEVVVNNKLNVPAFIKRVKEDTTFYKAFRSLHIIGFTALNDIRMLDKHNQLKASLLSKTQQLTTDGCRTMKVLGETTSGNIYDAQHNFNYYTGELYAAFFFTKGMVCGENNIVRRRDFSTQGMSGIQKHKEQLKTLFFNPGKRIAGLPFIGNKTALFDADQQDKYDFSIDMAEYNKTSCYIFKIKAKSRDVVIDEMNTWFNDKTFEIVARTYSLSYDAALYDFNVQMQVDLTKYNGLLLPSLIRYTGNWKVFSKKREVGIFTATLFAFNTSP